MEGLFPTLAMSGEVLMSLHEYPFIEGQNELGHRCGVS